MPNMSLVMSGLGSGVRRPVLLLAKDKLEILSAKSTVAARTQR